MAPIKPRSKGANEETPTGARSARARRQLQRRFTLRRRAHHGPVVTPGRLFCPPHLMLDTLRTDHPMLLVRPPSDTDCRAIAELLAILGYPVSEDGLRKRLPRLSSETACIVVAELDHVVVGLATAHSFDALHLDTPAAWLTALVVRPQVQRMGIGRALARQIETWIRERGCSQIGVLTS